MPKAVDPKKLDGLIRQAKSIGRRYYELTGRPLGVTGEVGEYEACRRLKLLVADVRETGYDASRGSGAKRRTYQVKARRVHEVKPGQKLGAIKVTKPWDAVIVVLLDAAFETTSIHEADRPAIERALLKRGPNGKISKARQRGQLTVSEFKSIGRQVWPK